jgi:hypothetical protein
MDDPLTKQAETLVGAANANAISAFIPLLNRFPFLESVDTKQWDFVLTIAGVFIAVTRLSNLKLGEHREEELLMKVSAALDQWDAANGIGGFEHCKSVYEMNFDALTKSGYERRFITSDAIGLWIYWMLFGVEGGSEKEKELIRVVGGGVTHAFFDWWDDDVKGSTPIVAILGWFKPLLSWLGSLFKRKARSN